MKPTYIIGAVAAILTGIAGVWGVNSYLSLKNQLVEVQKNAQSTSLSPSPTPSPPTQTGASASAGSAPPSSLAPTAEVKFESLPLCDQLDGIASSNKSVSEFIVNSGRYKEFAAQVTTKCNWHVEQLEQADRILHPPVANNPPTSSSDDPQPRRTPWNDCDGLQEPGESASIDCRARKAESDRIGKAVPGDNRPDHLQEKSSHSDDDYYYDLSDGDTSTGDEISQSEENETENYPSRSREGQSDSSRNRVRERQRDNSEHESRSERSNYPGNDYPGRYNDL